MENGRWRKALAPALSLKRRGVLRRRKIVDACGRGRKTFSLAQQQRDKLDRFSQTHVVGEARAQAEAVEEGQPVQTAQLIRAKVPFEGFGLRDRFDRLA